MAAARVKGGSRLPLSRTRVRILREFRLFDSHVLEFAGFKDFPAFQTFHELGVFFAGHDLHTGVLALCHIAALLGRLGQRGWSHKFRVMDFRLNGSGEFRRKLAVF
jgi:hypothetical protein